MSGVTRPCNAPMCGGCSPQKSVRSDQGKGSSEALEARILNVVVLVLGAFVVACCASGSSPK